MQRLLVICITLVAMLATATACIAQHADVREGFMASNSNNGWEYGFIDEDGEFIVYNTTFDDGHGIAGWCLDNVPGPMGAITINYSDHPIDEYGVHWEPGQICVLPPSRGLSAAIRWNASMTETVVVDTILTAQSRNASVGMSLTAHGQELANGRLGSSKSDASADTVSSAYSNEVARSATARVKRGETVDLIITGHANQPSGHVGVAVFINPAEAKGNTNAASLGRKIPAKQAMLVGADQWSKKSEFDTLVERG